MLRTPLLRRALGAPLIMILLLGCASAPRQLLKASAVSKEIAALERFADEGWHLPLNIRVLRQGDVATPLSEPEAELLRSQLAEIQKAYSEAPFDFYGAELLLRPSGADLYLEYDAEQGLLRIELADRIAPADELIDALAKGYRWASASVWWLSQPAPQLIAALRRDLGKLDTLEQNLTREKRRLIMVNEVATRRKLAGGEWILSPSEARFARAAQLRATRALHRLLNTIGRWRSALDDERFPHPTEALVVVARARTLHEVALGELLEVIVGQRPTASFWRSDFWQRSKLYKLLDGKTEQLVIAGERVGTLPEGSVSALLKQHSQLQLRLFYGDLDARVEEADSDGDFAAALGRRAHGAALGRAWKQQRAQRAIIEGQGLGVDGWTALRELWEARMKGGLRYPYATSVKAVSRFLGAIRLSRRAPAIDSAQLKKLDALLEPGDIVLVRQDGYLSNTFLPGFFTHALIYLGASADWSSLRLEDGTPLRRDPLIRKLLSRYQAAEAKANARVIEAVGKGVIFSSLKKAVGKDYLLALRPRVSEAQRARALRTALSYHGRPYDFDFDFETDDRVVCTELVYRAYSGAVNLGLESIQSGQASALPGLREVAGRWTLPANDVARRVVAWYRRPDGPKSAPLAILRLLVYDPDAPRARVYEGSKALDELSRCVER
jgi:hypothetical protein